MDLNLTESHNNDLAVLKTLEEPSINFMSPQTVSMALGSNNHELFSELCNSNSNDADNIFDDFSSASSLKNTELQNKPTQDPEAINPKLDDIGVTFDDFSPELLTCKIINLDLESTKPKNFDIFEQSFKGKEDIDENPTNTNEIYLNSSYDDIKDNKIIEEEPPLPLFVFREPSINDDEPPESQNSYFQELKMYRVQMTEWSDQNFSNYVPSETSLSPQALNRITKEINAMSKSLPCESSGSIFLAVDSTNLGRMKVIISGAEDTPYEHGLFLFNIHLSENYPNTPPAMTIQTTGNGTLRFNPNLYNTGFVCLSIINTWDGNPEEMWNPSFSTLMQVFLSIQSLVMTSDIIQKEPGNEHLNADSIENQAYSTIVKYGTIAHAIIGMIKNPPIEFKDVVLKHFALKREKILQTVEKWISELTDISAGLENRIVNKHNVSTTQLFSKNSLKTLFIDLFENLKNELNTLPSL